MPSPLSGRPKDLHSLIESFLQERRDVKLEKLEADDTRREALLSQFEFTAWIDDAARRVGQIQAVTHALKATHPDARGTSVYQPPQNLPQHTLVGSHHLGAGFASDVVGNAAALDIHKFLKLSHEGRTLLELMLADDPDLCAALSADLVKAQAWVKAFTGITQARSGPPTSHTMAKQIYWLVGDDPQNDADYHLLAPLYASSLAHAVHLTITEDRFGEAAKTARQARRAEEFSDVVLHDYPQLAVQGLGGTKPQNISQLNSERGGNNYLLASLPPMWVSADVQPLLNVESVLSVFGRREAVRPLVRGLRTFLAADPGKTWETRNQREDWTDQLMDELLQFASLIQTSLLPGWSASPDCRLSRAQQLWLDPDRALTDDDFAAEWKRQEWRHDIHRDFANWLNARLKIDKLLVGDPEYLHWAKELKDEPEMRWQIDQQRRRLEKLEAMREELGDVN